MIDIEDVTIEEVMTHRGVVTMIDINSSADNIYKIVGESPYTIIPVFSGTQDNIIGILHAKELFRFLQRNRFQNINMIDLKDILIDPYFV